MSQLDFASFSGAFVYNQPVYFRQVKEAAPAAIATGTASVSAADEVVATILPELLQQVYDEFIASLSQERVKSLNGRLERGLGAAKTGYVLFTEQEGVFVVRSSHLQDGTYTVNLNEKTCTCPDSQYHNTCKHRFAAWLIQEALKRTAVMAPEEALAPSEVEALADAPADTDPVIMVSAARPAHEAIIWGVAQLDESTLIPVEIVEMLEDHAMVRALPEIVNGELRPRYPFPSPFEGSNVRWCSAVLPREFISSVKVYR